MCIKASVINAVGLLLALLIVSVAGGADNANAQTVQLTAIMTENPPAIRLQAQADPNAVVYTVSRKLLGDTTWTRVVSLRGSTFNWMDGDVTLGAAYEYQVIKTSNTGTPGYGYICAGIRRTAVESPGKLILLVEELLGAQLAPELARLQRDLVGDGWTVLRRDVGRALTPPQVKQLVRMDYNADPAGTKALFIFGNVAVPHSGNITPDIHEDHRGAWPADVYYGEFSGAWTDTVVSNKATHVPNVPGDGKFDQDSPPGSVRLQIGRVDLSKMTCFANKTPSRSETDLARRYLNKDHAFRHGQWNVPRRALIFDREHRGMEPEPQTATAWRHFPAFFGRDQIRVIGPDEYFPILRNEGYLWSYVVSGGSWYGCDNIGTSDSWALEEPKVVFTSFLGSYFGEWDRESDFLRAPLGAGGYALTSMYGGQPQWMLHTMAMGEPIGYSVLLTQNNAPGWLYPPQTNAGHGQVHIALMGDPTLRMHPVKPPTSLQGSSSGGGISLAWGAANDSGIVGYHVYKAGNPAGPFTRISGANAATGLSFTDAAGTANDHYMVRAVKLETSPSGSYYNLSQGIFHPEEIDGNNSEARVPTDLTAMHIGTGAVTIEWKDDSQGLGYLIQRRTLPSGAFANLTQTAATYHTDASIAPGQYAYRVKTLCVAGDSAFSGEVVANLQPPAATILGIDKITGGDWIGRYGAQGHVIPGAGTNLPPYAQIGASNVTQTVWTWDTKTNAEALFYPNGVTRLISTWGTAHRPTLTFFFRFNDNLPHRVAIYMLDHSGARAGTVAVTDPLTGNVMHSASYSNYLGQYVVLDIRNYADVHLISSDPARTVTASGIFFDVANVGVPVITPGGGNFAGRTTVTISPIAGATVRYTTDGSDPGPMSAAYTGPFALTTHAEIVARAFREGYPPSAAARAKFTNTLESVITFEGADTATQGDWRNKYGQIASSFVGRTPQVPSHIELTGSGSAWTWADGTAEPRAVNKYNGSASGRVASSWYAANEMTFNVTIFSNAMHQVSLYFLDWDRSGRSQEVTVTDGAGQVVYSQTLAQFEGGRHLVFNAKGSFRVTLKKLSGPNAVLNGIFIGPGTAMSAEPPRLSTGILGGGNYTVRVTGIAGQMFDIQSTQDFKTWVTIGRRTLSGTTADVSLPVGVSPGLTCFRTILVGQ